MVERPESKTERLAAITAWLNQSSDIARERSEPGGQFAKRLLEIVRARRAHLEVFEAELTKMVALQKGRR
jgi:hypothetical protein